MCQQLAVTNREKITACLQEPELYHRMLTKDLHYLLFRDQVIIFISYTFNSNCLINAPNVLFPHTLSGSCLISSANSNLNDRIMSCFCEAWRAKLKSWKLCQYKRWPAMQDYQLKHSYALILVSMLCINILQLFSESAFRRHVRKMSCWSTM